MQDTIFTIELPFIKTNEELEKVKELYPQYDSYFIASGCCKERREKFDKLWAKYKPYADRHFLNQIRTNFHQRSWEMYVGKVFLEKKLIMQSKNEGPDFVIDKTAYVECVAPTKGDPAKPDSVPKMRFGIAQDVPTDKMILRITQAIKDKALEQYEKWKSKNWFDSKMSFVIAVNTGDLAFPQDYFGIPIIIKALFGLGFMQISRDSNQGYSWRESIKKGDSEVPVNYFSNEKFSFVSGVLFSDKLVLDHPDNIGEDCLFVNNPFAKNPANDEFIKLFKSWTASKDSKGINLKKGY